MLHTITATVCLHPIRSAAELPLTEDGINFSVPYCGACLASRKVAAEHDTAESEHMRLEEESMQDPYGDQSELREARIRYDKAHLAYLRDCEQQVDQYADDHGMPQARSFAGVNSILKSSMSLRPKKDLLVRFDDTDKYRPEEECRSQEMFDRTTAHYEPGEHADESGEGFMNTSDPYKSDEESDEDIESLLRDLDSDEEMESVLSEAEDEENEEDVDGTAHLPSEEEGGANGNDEAEQEENEDEEEDGESDVEELTREEIMERTRIIQERLDQIIRKQARRAQRQNELAALESKSQE